MGPEEGVIGGNGDCHHSCMEETEQTLTPEEPQTCGGEHASDAGKQRRVCRWATATAALGRSSGHPLRASVTDDREISAHMRRLEEAAEAEAEAEARDGHGQRTWGGGVTTASDAEPLCHPCSECGPACGCWCMEDDLYPPSAASEMEEDEESILCSSGEERRGRRSGELCGTCCSMKSIPVTQKETEALPTAVTLDGPPVAVPLDVSLQEVRRMGSSGGAGVKRRAARCSFEVDLGSQPIAAIQILVSCSLFFRLSLFQGVQNFVRVLAVKARRRERAERQYHTPDLFLIPAQDSDKPLTVQFETIGCNSYDEHSEHAVTIEVTRVSFRRLELMRRSGLRIHSDTDTDTEYHEDAGHEDERQDEPNMDFEPHHLRSHVGCAETEPIPLRKGPLRRHRKKTKSVQFKMSNDVLRVATQYKPPPVPKSYPTHKRTRSIDVAPLQDTSQEQFNDEQLKQMKTCIKAIAARHNLTYAGVLDLAIGRFYKRDIPPYVEEFIEWFVAQQWINPTTLKPYKVSHVCLDRKFLQPLVEDLFSVQILYGPAISL